MAASFLRCARKSLFRRAWKPLVFSKDGIVSIPAGEKVEEETVPGYVASRYYPVRIGEIFQDRYQVVGKLGFGITSTVWLARDLELPEPVVAFMLRRIFQALDLLHEECHVAHTDIKEANILLGADSSVLTQFEHDELKVPSARKEVDDGIVYLSRDLGTPRDFGAPVLCDFGSAVPLDDGLEHREDIQPDVYRSPEVILDVPWTYSVDIWNVGCMVWDALEGEHLFTGRDPELETYRGRAHLAEMIALLGPPPPSLLARAKLRNKFFTGEGDFSAGITIPCSRPLEHRETALRGEESKAGRECFLRFMRKMLQWEPEERSSARELAEDEWILKHTT